MEVNKMLQSNLCYLRKQKNLSMEKVAAVINVSRQAYSAYEYGKSIMSIESLKLLADFYGITIDLLLSSSLIDGRQPTIVFSSIGYEDSKLKFKDIPFRIRNINSSLIMVKIDTLTFKVFESTVTHLIGREQLIDYKGTHYCAKLYYKDDGSGCIVTDKEPIFFSKKQAESVVIIGLLMATINKEYEVSDFL